MNVRIQQQALTKVTSDVLVVPLLQGEQQGESIRTLDTALAGTLEQQITHSGFAAKEGETLVFPTYGRLPSRTLLLLGVGKPANLASDLWRRCAARAHREAKGQGTKQLTWYFSKDYQSEEQLAAVVEGTCLAAYSFEKYKSEKNGKPVVETLTLVGAELRATSALTKALDLAQQVIPGVFLARDLINEPASVSTPTYLADHAAKILRGNGIKGEIWGPAKIKVAKMAGLLAVARGSVEEPR